jgi:hypothetical protein
MPDHYDDPRRDNFAARWKRGENDPRPGGLLRALWKYNPGRGLLNYAARNPRETGELMSSFSEPFGTAIDLNYGRKAVAEGRPLAALGNYSLAGVPFVSGPGLKAVGGTLFGHGSVDEIEASLRALDGWPTTEGVTIRSLAVRPAEGFSPAPAHSANPYTRTVEAMPEPRPHDPDWFNNPVGHEPGGIPSPMAIGDHAAVEQAIEAGRSVRSPRADYDLGNGEHIWLMDSAGQPIPATIARDQPLNVHTRANQRLRIANTKRGWDQTAAEIEQALTPREAEWFRNASKAQRDVVVRNYLRAPHPEALASAALAGAPLRGWYKSSSQALVNSFGDDAPRFAAVLAGSSPRQTVTENLEMALDIWEDWERLGRPTDSNILLNLAKKHADMEGRYVNVARALAASDEALTDWQHIVGEFAKPWDRSGRYILSGPKVDPFYANILGEVNRIVNDVHMAHAVGTTAGGIGTAGRMTAINASVRNAIEVLQEKIGHRFDPSEIQEMVWGYAQSLSQNNSPAWAVLEEFNRRPGSMAAAISESPTFGSLMASPRFKDRIAALPGVNTPVAIQRQGFPVIGQRRQDAINQEHLIDIAQRVDASLTDVRAPRVPDNNRVFYRGGGEAVEATRVFAADSPDMVRWPIDGEGLDVPGAIMRIEARPEAKILREGNKPWEALFSRETGSIPLSLDELEAVARAEGYDAVSFRNGGVMILDESQFIRNAKETPGAIGAPRPSRPRLFQSKGGADRYGPALFGLLALPAARQIAREDRGKPQGGPR